MKAMLWICAIVLLGGQMGCQWYEDYRIKKGTADIREETAEMMRAHRVCLQRYEREPPKANEHCAPYAQSLREVEIKREFGR
jgi:hypothetical protein